jgi:ribosomal protein L37E
MGEVVGIPDEENVLGCERCEGQSFLVLLSKDGNRITGFECLRCGKREYAEYGAEA